MRCATCTSCKIGRWDAGGTERGESVHACMKVIRESPPHTHLEVPQRHWPQVTLLHAPHIGAAALGVTDWSL